MGETHNEHVVFSTKSMSTHPPPSFHFSHQFLNTSLKHLFSTLRRNMLLITLAVDCNLQGNMLQLLPR